MSLFQRKIEGLKDKIDLTNPSGIKNEIAVSLSLNPSRWARNEFQEERQRVDNNGEVKRCAGRGH